MMALKGRWGAPVGDAGGEAVMTPLFFFFPLYGVRRQSQARRQRRSTRTDYRGSRGKGSEKGISDERSDR
jgi:hypothetical protein